MLGLSLEVREGCASGVEEGLMEELRHLHIVVFARVHLYVDYGLEVDLVTSQHLA